MRSRIFATIGISALFALTACSAAPADDETQAPPAKENAAEAARPKIGTEMRSQCMVNDDGSEAICCSSTRCWYVDLRDPYSYR